MRSQRIYWITIIAFLSILAPWWTCNGAEITLNDTPVKVCFSPNGGCAKAIVYEINNAKSQILVQAYSFTSKPIAKALLAAHKRGVKVEVIIDKNQLLEKYNSATFLANSGLPVFMDGDHAIAHDKIMIIDGKTVVTGSFNFTNAAEYKNAENLLIIKSDELAKIYTSNWNKHFEHSIRFGPRY